KKHSRVWHFHRYQGSKQWRFFSMAGKGPRRTPTEELQARGSSLAKHRIGSTPTPIQADRVPSPPSWLAEEGKKAFKAHARMLHKEGLLPETAVPMLAMACALYAHFVECQSIGTANGPMHPSWKE